MLTHREFSLRKWSERFAWSALAILFALVLALPMADDRRLAILQFLLVVAAYLVITFRFLFPRWKYSPRLVYATLWIDLLIIGALDLPLEDQLKNFDFFFIPIIVAAAIVSGWRGTVLIALAAALIEYAIAADWAGKPQTLLDLLITGAAFVLAGISAMAVREWVRRQTFEAAGTNARAAESERQRRADAEASARRWQVVNAVGMKVQQEQELPPLFAAIGAELATLDLDCAIARWEEPGKTMRLEYISIAPGLLQKLERTLGVTAHSFRLTLANLPDYRHAIAAQQTHFAAMSRQALVQVLPGSTGAMLAQILDLIGLGYRIIAPLIAGEKVLGIFWVWGRDLSERDIPAMTALAQHIAAALEKTAYRAAERKRAAQLALVSEIAERAAGIFDMEELLEQVTRLIVERFGYQNVSIFVNDLFAHQVILRAHAGAALNRVPIGYRQAWETGLIGLSARTGQTIVVNDVRQEPLYLTLNRPHDSCRSEMCVPFKRGTEVLGILDLQSAELDAFGQDDSHAMEALASQIAGAIAKAELFAAERKRAAQLSLVSAIAEKVSMILDPDLLLQQVAELVRERFGYHNVAVFLLDAAGTTLELAANANPTRPKVERYAQSTQVGLMGWATRTRQTIVVGDVTADSRYIVPAEFLAPTRSELCVPLRFGDKTLGLLDVQSDQCNAFDASDVAAMETLANQISIALENARLYRDARRRLAQTAVLYEFSRAIAATLDAPELARRAISALESILAYRYSAILLVEAAGQLTPFALSDQGRGPEFGRTDAEFINQFQPRVGRGITGWVAQTGASVRSGNVALDPRYGAVRADVKSELCVPLKIGERVIGVLNVESPGENAFTEDDERILTTLAAPLAIAIENARLYARAKDDAEVKAALLREISHRIKNNLTAIAGLLYLGLDEEKTTRQEILSETLARVQSMVVAHALLSDSARARVNLLELARHILSDSARHLALPGQHVPCVVTGEGIEISARQASSVALVLNELITNALKHARSREPRLDLTVARQDSRAVMELFNHGDVLPEDFSSTKRAGVGLSLIRTLVEKDLQGRFELISRTDPRGVAGIISFVPET